MRFTIYQASHIGGRNYNQDEVAHAYTNEALLLVLSDGMGGHLFGEIAAKITIHTFMQAFKQAAKPRVQAPARFLHEAMQSAHLAIIQYARDQRLGGNPGATCVAALVQDGQVFWAYAGDSRFYLLRDGKVAAVTHDHSAVQQWADWGIISPAEMKTHPDRNRITNCLGGVEDMFFVDSPHTAPLQSGDILLLCSDGLWGPLTNEEIAAAFSLKPLSSALPQLMGKALQLGGQHADNTTAVIARWGEAEDEQTTAEPVCMVLDT